jgi:lipopolysaccharide/colanic/teichoic acid biosynthesis glycosyltransferase
MTTASAAAAPVRPGTATPTVWGCTPRQVHDRFWAAFGVQIVRRHERSEIVAGAELFLLCEPDALVLFGLAEILDTIYWLDPELVLLRLRDTRARAYREVAVTDGDRLVRFERVYRDSSARFARVALTRDPGLARRWQNAPDIGAPWRWLKSEVDRGRRLVRSIPARVYDERHDAQVMDCVRDLIRVWDRPETTVPRARRARGEVFSDPTSHVPDDAMFVGPVWVGAGRTVASGARVVGPAVMWDAADARPPVEEVRWQEIEPASLADRSARRARSPRIPGKRAFDVVFSAAVLALTLPLYPFVALAILLDDGRPIFFAHRRETTNGREFPCLKFRSMKNDADAGRAVLQRDNQADGPQFYIKEDPRVTRVGKILRRFQIDELPQFINVLLGHMSVVGPRPSPYCENQFCPPWREARLSVRPGVTGLWQVSRTRKRGLDFQEWIRYDLEYVQNASWVFDLRIIWRTVKVVLTGDA